MTRIGLHQNLGFLSRSCAKGIGRHEWQIKLYIHYLQYSTLDLTSSIPLLPILTAFWTLHGHNSAGIHSTSDILQPTCAAICSILIGYCSTSSHSTHIVNFRCSLRFTACACAPCSLLAGTYGACPVVNICCCAEPCTALWQPSPSKFVYSLV